MTCPSAFAGRTSALLLNNTAQLNNRDSEKPSNHIDSTNKQDSLAQDQSTCVDTDTHDSFGQISTAPSDTCLTSSEAERRDHVKLETVECLLLLKLCDVALKLPIDSKSLQRSICRVRGLESTSRSIIENLLEKFALQELVSIEEPQATIINRHSIVNSNQDDETCVYVVSADHTRLVDFDKSIGIHDNIRAMLIESKIEDSSDDLGSFVDIKQNPVPIQNVRSSSSQAGQSSSNDSIRESLPQHERVPLNQVGSTRGFIKSPLSGKSDGLVIENDLESLLSLSSTKERESKKLGEELLELLSKPSSKERNLLESFRSADGYRVQEFCPKGTKDECRRNRKAASSCEKLHFKKIIAKHTEESLGDCSFLNTCFHMDSCKYVHYEVDYDNKQQVKKTQLKRLQSDQLAKSESDSTATFIDHDLRGTLPREKQSTSKTCRDIETNKDKKLNRLLPTTTASLASTVPKQSTQQTQDQAEQARIEAKARKRFKTVLYPPQWIQCDLRYFDMSLLGKFSVVMADPPWDIHMELPYGTMSDDEMRKLNIPALQDDGVIFLWVTGRAMELGRECLALWGYERCDEIIWVKTNQLQRIIRTGRTGHWLNHGKEHCLVGVKGNPTDINRGLDCDIIVAEVRATSHKPDEIYGIIERLSPGTRKIELFGRAHNVQPNWITLGNQLSGVRLVEPNLIEAFKKLNMPFQTGDHLS